MSRQPVFNAGPAICLILLTAFIVGLGCGIGWLERHMEFSSLMLFGAIVIPAMISCGYAWDWLTARRH